MPQTSQMEFRTARRAKSEKRRFAGIGPYSGAAPPRRRQHARASPTAAAWGGCGAQARIKGLGVRRIYPRGKHPSPALLVAGLSFSVSMAEQASLHTLLDKADAAFNKGRWARAADLYKRAALQASVLHPSSPSTCNINKPTF